MSPGHWARLRVPSAATAPRRLTRYSAHSNAVTAFLLLTLLIACGLSGTHAAVRTALWRYSTTVAVLHSHCVADCLPGTGDIHQPLHAATMYSQARFMPPKGDEGMCVFVYARKSVVHRFALCGSRRQLLSHQGRQPDTTA